jgi:alcohol dehydrogenase class IV
MDLHTGVPAPAAFTVGAGDHLSLTTTLATGQHVRFARGARRELPELLLGLADVGAGAAARTGAAAGNAVGRAFRSSGGGIGLVTSRSQVASGLVGELQAALGPAARCFDEVRPHATEELCDRASAALEGVAAVAGIGGGSALGIAKAVAARLRVPLVAVPTTYSGSELTELYGVTRAGRKQVVRDAAARPAHVVYDPDLTDTLPPHARAASLMNCLAHCIECSWNDPADGAVVEAGLEGCRHVGRGSALIAREDGAAAGRDHLLAAGMWGGLALAGGTGVHHAVCHAVGGLTGASHGDINAIVLPTVMAALADRTADIQRRLVEPLRPLSSRRSGAAPHDVMRDIRDGWGLPARLRDAGVTRDDIPGLVAHVTAARPPAPGVVTLDAGALTDLLLATL